MELVDNGTTVTLRNGVVSATLVKATAQTSALYLTGSAYGNQGVNVLGGSHGGGYTTFNYAIGATTYVKGSAAPRTGWCPRRPTASRSP